MRQAALDRLKEENSAPLQHLSTLETSGAHNTPAPTAGTVNATGSGTTTTTTELVPRASWAAVCEEKAQLEEELRQKEKRMLRLRQVFAAKTAEFREALSAILGVKVAFYDNGQVRVTSQYDLGAAFILQPAKDSTGTGADAARCAGRGRTAGVATVDAELGRD